MSWAQEDHTVTFWCDTCDKNTSINAAEHRNQMNIAASDYAVAESRLPDWLALKRVGHDWTHHCAACADQAERDHATYQQQDAVRERIKARNA